VANIWGSCSSSRWCCLDQRDLSRQQIIRLDPGLRSPVAICDRHFRDSCHYYDRGTSEREREDRVGMCERRAALDNLSYRRVRDREYTPRVLHHGFFQFVHAVRSVPAGGHRVSDLYAPPHLAVPDEAGTLFELEIAGGLIGLEGFFCFFTLIATDQLGYRVAGSYLWMLCLIGGRCLSFYLVCASHGYVYGYDSLRLYHDYDLLRFYNFVS